MRAETGSSRPFVWDDRPRIDKAGQNNLTARQRLLVYSFVKELYDHREKYQNGTQQLTNAVSTMLLNEKYGGSSE